MKRLKVMALALLFIGAVGAIPGCIERNQGTTPTLLFIQCQERAAAEGRDYHFSYETVDGDFRSQCLLSSEEEPLEEQVGVIVDPIWG